MEHVHPGSSIRPVSGGAEQEVFLDRHIADERQNEQRHAEHDEPQRAGDPHHPASLRAAAPPDQRITDRPGPGRGDSEHPGAPHQRQNEGGDAEITRAARRFQSPCGEEEQTQCRRKLGLSYRGFHRLNGRQRGGGGGGGDASAAKRRAEMQGRTSKQGRTDSSFIDAFIRGHEGYTVHVWRESEEPGSRFCSRVYNLNMRQGGSDASAAEKTQEERV